MNKKSTIVTLVANHSLWQVLWRDTSTQFMKATQITNVKLVVNYFLMPDIWRTTSTQFMKTTKITNVNSVSNCSNNQEIWIFTSKGFTMVKRTTNATFAVRFLPQLRIWTTIPWKNMARNEFNRQMTTCFSKYFTYLLLEKNSKMKKYIWNDIFCPKAKGTIIYSFDIRSTSFTTVKITAGSK